MRPTPARTGTSWSVPTARSAARSRCRSTPIPARPRQSSRKACCACAWRSPRKWRRNSRRSRSGKPDAALARAGKGRGLPRPFFGRPGICFVTRGPGATNASPGIHIARQDSTPMILFVGQIAREARDREAFQELDYRAVFGSMAKWATEIDAAERIPEIVSRAFYTATNGRPGPVVVALPEDMLAERVAVTDARPFEPVETWPGLTDMTRLQKLL